MHIPDQMISGAICPITGIIAVGGLAITSVFAMKQKEKPDSMRFGAVAALLFGLQMLNFPISGATSGHFLGGALSVSLLGTPFGILAMYLLVGVQAFVFGDGGVLVLGANALTMGLVGAGFGGLTRTLLTKTIRPGTLTAFLPDYIPDSLIGSMSGFLSAFLSVAASAFACSIILSAGTSQTVQSVLSAMMGVHFVIAVFEGIITICVLRLAESLKSDLCLLGLAVTAGLVSPLASSLPDGLETVAHALGITSVIQAGTQVFSPIFMEYSVPFLPGTLSAIMAGVAGVWICYCVGKRILMMGAGTACFISKTKNH